MRSSSLLTHLQRDERLHERSVPGHRQLAGEAELVAGVVRVYGPKRVRELLGSSSAWARWRCQVQARVRTPHEAQSAPGGSCRTNLSCTPAQHRSEPAIPQSHCFVTHPPITLLPAQLKYLLGINVPRLGQLHKQLRLIWDHIGEARQARRFFLNFCAVCTRV